MLFRDLQEWKLGKGVQILLTSISPKLYARLKELIRLKEFCRVNYGELEQLLRQNFERHSNVPTERYTFHKLVQQLGQPVKVYIEQVRKRAAKCQFSTFKADICKDQMVLGVMNGSLRKSCL